MEYIIEKDNHYPNGVHDGQTSQVFELMFDKKCWYKPIDSENDYNKVFGWSYGILPRRIDDEIKPAHHYNSIRIGWRPVPDSKGCIEVSIYVYEDGVRRVSEVGLLLDVEREYLGKLYYELNDVEVPGRIYLEIHRAGIISMEYSANPTKGYILNPYFGGNAPAPKTMTINLKKLS